MRFRRRFSRFRGVSFKVKKQLSRARRYASKNKKTATTLKTALLAVGGYLVYDKFLKKN